MNEITINVISFPSPDTEDDYGNSSFHGPTNSVAVFVQGYPLRWGKAELYAIKTALEKQVQLNAEVERLRKRNQHNPTRSWVAKFPVSAAH